MNDRLLAALTTTILLASGCNVTSSLLFRDTFEADAIGAEPNASPPGDPSGDSVQAPSWAEVQQGHFISSKVVRVLGEPNPDGLFDTLNFRGVRSSYGTNAITVMWVGCVGDPQDDDVNKVGRVTISLGDDDTATSYVTLDFIPFGNVPVKPAIQITIGQTVFLAEYEPNVPHVAILTLSRAGTCDLSLMHAGGAEASDIFIDDEPLHVAITRLDITPMLKVLGRRHNLSHAWAQTYEIDEILMMAQEPSRQRMIDFASLINRTPP